MAPKLTFRLSMLIINVIGCLWIAVVITKQEQHLKYKQSINSSRNTSALQQDRFQEVDQQIVYTRKIVVDTIYPIVLSRPYKINNENICKNVSNLSVIVIVHTTPSNFESRKLMRKTYLNSSHYRGENIRVAFLLGLVSESTLQTKIEDENSKFHDIVQGYFIDSYHNLTNKGVMGFKWITEFCRNAEFVLKMDDDVFINFFKVFAEVSSIIKRKTKYIMCYVTDGGKNPVQREKGHKWYVHPDEFRLVDNYPSKSCSGLAVFLSIDLVPMLYRAALMSPFFWVDDYYLFGILPSKIYGTVHDSLNVNMSLYDRKGLPCYIDKGKQCPFVVSLGHGQDNFINRCWDAVTKDTNSTFNKSNTKSVLNITFI